jgi:hypothetical protein
MQRCLLHGFVLDEHCVREWNSIKMHYSITFHTKGRILTVNLYTGTFLIILRERCYEDAWKSWELCLLPSKSIFQYLKEAQNNTVMLKTRTIELFRATGLHCSCTVLIYCSCPTDREFEAKSSTHVNVTNYYNCQAKERWFLVLMKRSWLNWVIKLNNSWSPQIPDTEGWSYSWIKFVVPLD